MTMQCFPDCKVLLDENVQTSIRTKLDSCKHPATLTLLVKSGGKFTSSVYLADNGVEERSIRNAFMQLNLQVNFTTTSTGAHHVLASFENIKTGNLTYFMNSTLHGDPCSKNQPNSDFLWVLLCIILITCLLFIGISVSTIMNKFNSSQKSSNSRKTSDTSIEKMTVSRKKTNQCTVMVGDSSTYLLSPNYYNDERLAVIAEVDEKDQVSEASMTGLESSNSLHQKLEQERRKLSSDSANRSKPTSSAPTPTAQKASFLFQKDHVILPQNLNYARRSSQPLIFPISNSLESIKTPQQQPQQMATFAV